MSVPEVHLPRLYDCKMLSSMFHSTYNCCLRFLHLNCGLLSFPLPYVAIAWPIDGKIDRCLRQPAKSPTTAPSPPADYSSTLSEDIRGVIEASGECPVCSGVALAMPNPA